MSNGSNQILYMRQLFKLSKVSTPLFSQSLTKNPRMTREQRDAFKTITIPFRFIPKFVDYLANSKYENLIFFMVSLVTAFLLHIFV